jgi:CheY-like chemotaxis protein
LVVDDEADIRELIATMLESLGAIVVTAASATAAIAALQEQLPDIVIADIGMPNVDGYALMRYYRALPPEQGGKLPAIALTAYAREHDQQQAIAAGFEMHLSKPVEPEILIKAIASLVKQR